jgi:hypothetical protein
MKFSAQEDLKLPQAEVFARLSNFETFERIAIKRNVRVSQISQSNPNEDTLGWNCRFKVRGRQRDVEIRLIEFDAPNSMKFHAVNPALHARLEIEVIPLSRVQTRIQVVSVLEPKTLAARLLVQSMKLARSKFNQRFKSRVGKLAEFISQMPAA